MGFYSLKLEVKCEKIFPPLVKVLYVEVFYYPRNPCACTLVHRQLVVFPKRTKQKVFLDVDLCVY